MNSDYDFPEPFEPEFRLPRSADCPACPCHTRRVCNGFLWHLSEPPTYDDGSPYTKPCPCERAASVPEDRTVMIELDGILRQVAAQYHHTGLLTGRLVTERTFRANSPHLGECPVPVPMGLYRPKDDTDPRLIVIDSAGEKWVMGFPSQHNLQRYRITGWFNTEA